jgi:hypothetical protein
VVVSSAAFASNVSFEEKQAALESKVRDGVVTAEAAESFLAEMQARQAACDCDGNCEGPNMDRERLGQKYGMGFGFGKRNDAGNGQQKGLGRRFNQ